MNWTALEIQTALGMSSITLENETIISGTGLPLDVANARLRLCIETGKIPPAAEAYQVRAWLIRNGISLDAISVMIAASVPAGTERDEALMRWEFATRVPMKHPLVAIVAASLALKVEDVWWDIVQI